jgi:hypothetical protein
MAITYDFFIIAHEEGDVLQATIDSVFQSKFEAAKMGEDLGNIHILLNNANQITADVALFNSHMLNVHESKFTSISDARNHITKLAISQLIFFLDGDDSVSKNWIYEAINVYRKKSQTSEPLVLVPEYIFRRKQCIETITKLYNSVSNQIYPYSIFFENFWVSSFCAPRSLFYEVNFPRISVETSELWEDWSFYLEVISKNINIYNVKSTYQLIRVSDKSLSFKWREEVNSSTFIGNKLLKVYLLGGDDLDFFRNKSFIFSFFHLVEKAASTLTMNSLTYKKINSDLSKMTRLELYLHYWKYGYAELRIHRVQKSLLKLIKSANLQIHEKYKVSNCRCENFTQLRHQNRSNISKSLHLILDLLVKSERHSLTVAPLDNECSAIKIDIKDGNVSVSYLSEQNDFRDFHVREKINNYDKSFTFVHNIDELRDINNVLIKIHRLFFKNNYC